MKHARIDYDERIQDASRRIPEEEPVFLLRGQDRYAYLAVQVYADMIEKDPGIPNDHVQAVRAQAHKMWEWSLEHGKSPDCPAPLLIKPGSEYERR